MESTQNSAVDNQNLNSYYTNILSVLFKDCPDGIVFKDKDFKYLAANNAFLKFYRIENPKDLIGKKCCKTLSKDNLKLVSEVNSAVEEEKQPISYIMNVEAEKGTPKIYNITTTPIQNIQALTMLANEGVMLKPYIIDKIVDPNTNAVLYEGKREELGQIVSNETVNKMRSLMHDVVYSGKTDASMFKPQTIEIIGKTGTAQIANPNGGGYLTGANDYVRSFATLFPANDPQYILYFSVKQFQGPFREVTQAVADIIDEIAKYKNLVAAISNEESKIYSMDNFLNLETTKSLEKLKSINLRIITMGDGNIITKQYPESNTKIISNSLIIFKTNSNNYIMPDLTGLTKSEVVTFCNFIGIKYKIIGDGLVSSTNIPIGNILDLNNTLEITLTNTN